MEQLFTALRDQHPGCDVVDVRFLVNLQQVEDQDVDELDNKLAQAVQTADQLPDPTK